MVSVVIHCLCVSDIYDAERIEADIHVYYWYPPTAAVSLLPVGQTLFGPLGAHVQPETIRIQLETHPTSPDFNLETSQFGSDVSVI